MTTAAEVPTTRGELEGDEALQTLRATGRRRLVVDAVDRFRAADAFSHSRALAFQLALTVLPALIAVVGFASAVGQEELSSVIESTIRELVPGAAGDILTAALGQGAEAGEEAGETALLGGGLAALVAGTTAMAQVERGANRLYGVERDRPFVRKYGVALVLALTAGGLGLLAGTVLLAGDALRDEIGFADELWGVLRWPLAIGLAVTALALLFEISPRRRQPEPSWLAFGAGASLVLWLAFMAVLDLYLDATESFGETYGPLAGTIGLLLWTFATSVALFFGLALAAQLEAVRAGRPETRRDELSEPG